MVALCLLSIIPYITVIYLFVHEKIGLTDTILLFSPLILMSILAGFSLLSRSAGNLADLARETGELGAGERKDPIKINADKEMNDIASNFNSLLRRAQDVDKEIKEQGVQLMRYARDLSLSYRKAKGEEELRTRLSRYVGENLVEKLLNSEGPIFPEHERKRVTIVFADIRSFTTIAERMEAEEVVSMLNQFFGIMVDIVFRNNGVLDKFIGDELMAIFGLLSPNENNGPHDAVKAAVEMQEATEQVMQIREKEQKETFEIGIGINTGSAIVGNVGAENRMDYTVIGNTVNVAARLEQVAKGGQIIIGEQTYLQTQGHFRLQKKGKLRVKNKTEPIICYEVLRAHGRILMTRARSVLYVEKTNL